jgi:predicted DNA-binding transcriptional regulator YafY
MLITAAAQARQQIHFIYQAQTGEASLRTIDPYGLVYRHGRWYACGYCHLRQDLRTFRVDRLSDATLLETHFNRPADFDAAKYLHRSIMTAPRKHPIRIVLHTDLAQATRAFGSIEALLQQQEDGLLLRTTTESLDYFARWLAFLPFSFIILEPPALKQAVRKQAQHLLSMTK